MFYEHSQRGIFSAPNLVNNGTGRDRDWKIISNLGINENPKRGDYYHGHPNWETTPLIDDFNNHMKDHSDLGALIVPYEIIFWSYLKMNPINGLDSKVLSDTATNIITKIELVQNNKVVDAKEHVKIYGQVRILLLNFVKLQV